MESVINISKKKKRKAQARRKALGKGCALRWEKMLQVRLELTISASPAHARPVNNAR